MSNNLEIKLMERPDASRFLEVRLTSIVKPQVIAKVAVEDQGAEERTRQAVLAAGGALAEHLGKQYGDQFNTGEVAREASELYRELMAEVRQRLH